MPIIGMNRSMINGIYCVSIVDEYYNNIAKNYLKYIGQSLKTVVKELSKTHVVKPYKIKDLQDSDAVLWKSKRDNLAHIMIYNNNQFFYSSPEGIKSHQVLLKYKNMLEPLYIVRLEESCHLG